MPSTQVSVVGLIQVTHVSSTPPVVVDVVLFFLVARCDFDCAVAAALLVFSSRDDADTGTLCALAFDDVRVVGGCRGLVGVVLGAVGPLGGEASPTTPISDSGTSLSSIG